MERVSERTCIRQEREGIEVWLEGVGSERIIIRVVVHEQAARGAAHAKNPTSDLLEDRYPSASK